MHWHICSKLLYTDANCSEICANLIQFDFAKYIYINQDNIMIIKLFFKIIKKNNALNLIFFIIIVMVMTKIINFQIQHLVI